MFLLYIVAYLDRVNVSFAALQMNAALGFSAEIYSLGAGIFFIGYFLFEVPSNLILHRVGARIWMARILITWGIISSAMMFVQGTASFYALRFLLGVAEAGFFPGMILYLTYWFPAHARGRAVARFMTATAIAGVIGSPISGVLLANGRNRRTWRLAVAVSDRRDSRRHSGIHHVRLPARRPQQREVAQSRREEVDRRPGSSMNGSRRQLHGDHSDGAALRSGRVWTFAAIYFAIIMSFYGVTFWLPQIVQRTLRE